MHSTATAILVTSSFSRFHFSQDSGTRCTRVRAFCAACKMVPAANPSPRAVAMSAQWLVNVAFGGGGAEASSALEAAASCAAGGDEGEIGALDDGVDMR